MVIEFLVQLLYATAADRASHLPTRPAFATVTNRVAGTLLIAAGLGLAAAQNLSLSPARMLRRHPR